MLLTYFEPSNDKDEYLIDKFSALVFECLVIVNYFLFFVAEFYHKFVFLKTCKKLLLNEYMLLLKFGIIICFILDFIMMLKNEKSVRFSRSFRGGK